MRPMSCIDMHVKDSKPAAGRAVQLCLLAAIAFGTSMALAQPAVPAKAEVCVACHGPAGKSTQPQFPILAGQTSRYLYLQLRDFQEGRRSDAMMSPIVVGLTRDEMRELADYFSRQTAP